MSGGSRSLSVSSLSSSVDTSGIEVEDLDLMDTLVHDVQRLSDCLFRLSAIMERFVDSAESTDQAYCIQVHDCLGEVSRTLKSLLDRYHFLRCSEVITPASTLIHTVKALKFDGTQVYRDGDQSYDLAQSVIQKLQFSVAERVGDYLTWEMSHYDPFTGRQVQSTEDGSSPSFPRSPISERPIHRVRRPSSLNSKSPKESLTEHEMDRVMCRMDQGLDLAFDRAKAWTKYCKDLLTFVQRRLALETEYINSLEKLARSTNAALQEERHLPLQSVYTKGFSLEMDFCRNWSAPQTGIRDCLVEYKFIKPLEQRRDDHENRRKLLKHDWDKKIREYHTARLELERAVQSFGQKNNAHKKARESHLNEDNKQFLSDEKKNKTKIDKLKKLEEEALQKKRQAAKERDFMEDVLQVKQMELEQLREKTVRGLRELTYRCDQTTKAVTHAYFAAMSGHWALLPLQYQNLSDAARDYVPGSDYRNFVAALPLRPNLCNPNAWKGRSNEDLAMYQRKSRWTKPVGARTPGPEVRYMPEPDASPLIPRFDSTKCADLDDSVSESSYGLPASYPSNGTAKLTVHRSYSDTVGRPKRLDVISSHNLQKSRGPAKCGLCHVYTFFSATQCTQCRVTWHKRCLSRMDKLCNPSDCRTQSYPSDRMSIFGVALHRHLADTQRQIPFILESCIGELEKRAARVKGLYRVCGTKSKIEQLCEDFERNHIDLTNANPHVISSVIKLYLRQLPESLLTDDLYDRVMEVGKAFSKDTEEKVTGNEENDEKTEAVAQLKTLLDSLPNVNYDSLQYLILHLKRITWFREQNLMSATNMGIVFGPTLIWPKTDGLNNWSDTRFHTRFVDLLVQHAHDIFGVDAQEDYERFVSQELMTTDQTNFKRRSSIDDAAAPRPPAAAPSRSRSERHWSTVGLDHHATVPLTNCGRGIGMLVANLAQPFVEHKETFGKPVEETSEQTSPAGSPNADRSRNSATPDLLKGRLPTERAISSPSSQENDYTVGGDCTSNDGDNEIFKDADTVTVAQETDVDKVDSVATTSKKPSSKTAPKSEIPSAGQRPRQFQRGRPIRRGLSKGRNYTTSIFIAPPSTSTERERKTSSDDMHASLLRGSSSGAQSGAVAKALSSLVQEKKKLAGSLCIQLNDSTQNLTHAQALALKSEEEASSKLEACKQPVHVTLSANPEDLSYV